MEVTKKERMLLLARLQGIHFEENVTKFGFKDAFNEFSEKVVLFDDECFDTFEGEVSSDVRSTPEYKSFIKRKKNGIIKSE